MTGVTSPLHSMTFAFCSWREQRLHSQPPGFRVNEGVNRTVSQVEPDFSTPGHTPGRTPRRSHDERATVCGKPQGASREP